MESPKRQQSEVLEAGLKGGTIAALPGIISGAVAENVKGAPRALHAISNKWVTGAVSAAGLSAAALHKAKQVGMGKKDAAVLMAGSGGGDAIGGIGGMLVGEELARAASRSIRNPALRIASSIGGAIAGDTAGGVAGNLAGGQLAKIVQGEYMKKVAGVGLKTAIGAAGGAGLVLGYNNIIKNRAQQDLLKRQASMAKTAMTASAPISEIKKFVAAKPVHKRIFNLEPQRGPAVIKVKGNIVNWHPEVNPNSIAAKKKILQA